MMRGSEGELRGRCIFGRTLRRRWWRLMFGVRGEGRIEEEKKMMNWRLLGISTL
jgi:hypothetical protein